MLATDAERVTGLTGAPPWAQHFLTFLPLPQGHGSFLRSFMTKPRSKVQASEILAIPLPCAGAGATVGPLRPDYGLSFRSYYSPLNSKTC
jgi:hypothetical protein